MSTISLRVGLAMVAVGLRMASAEGPNLFVDADTPVPDRVAEESVSFELTASSTVTLASGLNRPKLYDNTTVCTPRPHTLAVGGHGPSGPILSLLDWFEAGRGHIAGFDLYVLNGGTGAVPNSINELQFYQGSDELNWGSPIQMPVLARFRTIGAPVLSQIPVHRDPLTLQPRVIKVSVDYEARTYNVTDAETGVSLINPPNQFIGNESQRPSFDLPGGKLGVLLRFGNERSPCASPPGAPVCGPLLAGGGAGNVDGLIIFNSENCSPASYASLCDDPGWMPTQSVACSSDEECAPILGATCNEAQGSCTLPQRNACTGGDVCSLDRPFYGIALTLYVGPGDGSVDGNNDYQTADVVSPGNPAPCNGGLVSVAGFLGDNASSYTGTPTRFFDADHDDDIDLLDWWDFQRCFGRTLTVLNPGEPCYVHDYNHDRRVDLDDYGLLEDCRFSPDLPACSGLILDAPDLLQDIDLYQVLGVTPGHVFSALLEGDKSPLHGPTWDPFLRFFALQGGRLVQIGSSDDYERRSLDAFMTVKVPAAVNTLYVGVSSAANQGYDPAQPTSISALPPDEAGGYVLSVSLTDPACVVDVANPSCPAPPALCTCDLFETRHEPDDTLADADARGTFLGVARGMIGDGAFAGLGQDIDIYRLQFSGATAGTRSISTRIAGSVAGGFATEFDLALALYDAHGNLIACGDQTSTVQLEGNDQSRPQLAANVCGTGVANCDTNPSPDGVYYLAVLGTDRGLYDRPCVDDNGNPQFIFPSVPPSLLNFPHGLDLAGTQDTDLLPVLGGRVNKPGPRLHGCDLDPDIPPGAPTQQCYRFSVLMFTSSLGLSGPSDACELRGPDGDDSIPTACDDLVPSDRLSTADAVTRHLGNGHYGGFGGDVDFYGLHADPGDLIAVNIADDQQPQTSDHPVRSYLALYTPDGRPIAFQDLSLERASDSAIDGTTDEIAAILTATMPEGLGDTLYLMVGIDSGNLRPDENLPFDPFQPGTTPSRRFETGIWQPRRYNLAAAAIRPVTEVPVETRMFVTPLRGVDGDHVFCAVDNEELAPDYQACFPDILELDPRTGDVLQVLFAGGAFSTSRRASSVLVNPSFRMTANPIIAYDGSSLFISVEICGGDMFCMASGLRHPLFLLNPDRRLGQVGYITALGNIENVPTGAVLTGLAEMGGTLFALDTTNNRLRFWDKTMSPSAANVQSLPIPLLAGVFDDVDGDLGTDGASLYMKCLLSGMTVGIGRFTADFTDQPGIHFEEILPDPITNERLIPGPRLGGLDVLPGGVIVASDANGSIVEHFDPTSAAVRALVLPREFVAVRITLRSSLLDGE